MINTLFLWSTLIIIALLIKTGAPGLFYFLSIAIGSCAAALLSYYDYTITVQLSFCLMISCISLPVLRYIIRCTSSQDVPTNVQALIGQKARVIEPIAESSTGTVKIYSEIWLAREKNNRCVDHNEEVTIVAVEGCHLIVKK